MRDGRMSWVCKALRRNEPGSLPRGMDARNLGAAARCVVWARPVVGNQFYVFFFKQKTAYEIGLGIPAEPLFRSYSIVIGSKHITLNATGGGFLTASKQFRHGATSKSRSNTASNSTKHKSPHLSGWRQIISLIT